MASGLEGGSWREVRGYLGCLSGAENLGPCRAPFFSGQAGAVTGIDLGRGDRHDRAIVPRQWLAGTQLPMKDVKLSYWPGGRLYAVTFSYDDGRSQDRKLADLFRRYGLKGTFNLDAGVLDTPGHLRASELNVVFEGQEIAGHSYKHPHLSRVPLERMAVELYEDRKRLEEACGRIVRGFAYPFGNYSDGVKQALRACGYVYARTVNRGGMSALPHDWMTWTPDCHDREATPQRLAEFFDRKVWEEAPRLLCIWGHSWEFDREGGWEAAEDLCRRLSEVGPEKCWFATNIEVYDYAQVLSRLEFSLACDRVRNPSTADAWLEVEGRVVRVPGGATLML